MQQMKTELVWYLQGLDILSIRRMVSMKKKVKLGVLASGRGSNLQAIIDAIERGTLDAEIKIVISNVENAYALERARKHGIKTTFIEHRKKKRRDFEKELVDVLKKSDVELVILAGFMRILTPYFIKQFENRIMNIHPALLPSFPGLHAQEQAYNYGVKVSGCTVHFVNEDVDGGPIIIQKCVPVHENDTPETLAARILEEEHKAYPEAIQLFAEGRLKIEGRRVRILPKEE